MIYIIMIPTNFFEGFKKQMMHALNIRPEDTGEDYLDRFIVANPVIIDTQGNKYKLKGNIKFQVIFRGDNIIKIKDISYPDKSNRELADFPHGINSSPNAGQEYVMTKDQYDDLIQWRIPAGGEQPPL